jgi:parvulin-like peptidyl-prolyl isomerase
LTLLAGLPILPRPSRFWPGFPHSGRGISDMNGFKTQAPATGLRRSRAVGATLASLAALAVVGVAIRTSFGPGSANAQAPQNGLRQAAPAARPATSTAQPGSAPIVSSPRPGAAPASAAPRTGAGPAANKAPAAVASKLTPPPVQTLQVMAVVNSEQITRTDLGRECVRRYGEQVLESLVNRHLIADACQKQGIQVTEQDIDAEIDRIAQRFGLPRDRWLTLLEEERGFSEQQYRREVIWPMLALRQLAAGQIEVTPEELKKAFESEFGAKVKARLIAVSSKQKADQLRSQAVANPAEFGNLSKTHSEDPGVASAYGVIPPIRKHLGDASLEQVAFSLKPGEISPVVNVANMYYILKCEEHLPQQFVATQHLAEQQKRLSDRIRENKMRVAAAKFFEEVQKSSKIVTMFDTEKTADGKEDRSAAAKALPQGAAATIDGRQVSLQQLADECILRHGEEVLDGEINRKVLQQELTKKKLVIAPEDIDSEVNRAAEAYGFVKKDGTPDTDKWLASILEQEGATVDLYVRDAVWPSVALKKLVGQKVEVSQEDMQRGFESNYGERVEVLAIVLSDQRQAQKVWELARNNPTDDFFGQLAQQYSIEPSSRSNGGKVPPIQKHGGSPAIEDEAFKLKAGDLSGIVSVDGQFIVLRCLGRTKPVQVDFASVKAELHKDIHEKKMRIVMTKEFDRLRTTAQIDNFLAGTSQTGRSTRPTSQATIAPVGGMQARPQGGKVAPATALGPRPSGQTR